MKNLGKTIAGGVAGAAMLAATFVPALAAPVERVTGPWELTAPSDITFTCGGDEYEHTLNTVMNYDGMFEGTGEYDANTAYTWDIDGTTDGDEIEFTVVYNNANSGYTLNGDGIIDADGSIEGTLDNNCEEFSMPEGSAEMFEGNHGQYVKMQEDKQAAAHSRIGMPVQSKGHSN